MKLFSSASLILILGWCQLFTSTSLSAREIILITSGQNHFQGQAKGEAIREILIQQMGVPPLLINHSPRTHPCRPSEDAVLHICIAPSNAMRFIEINHQAVGAFSQFVALANIKKELPLNLQRGTKEISKRE